LGLFALLRFLICLLRKTPFLVFPIIIAVATTILVIPDAATTSLR
jgi:hypothetical protein